MTKLILVFVFLFSAVAPLSPVASAQISKTERYIVIGNVDMPKRGRVLREFKAISGYLADLTEDEARELMTDSRVKGIELDRRITPLSQTQSPTPSWGIDRIDQRALPLDTNYTYNATGLGVDVYVVDSGINYSHLEFGGRALPFFDQIGDGRNGEDCAGHGTHVAGIIGGATFGVAKGVTLYSARVFDCSNNGQIYDVVAAVDAITATARKGKSRPKVVNMSLTIAGSAPALEAAISQSISKGIVYTIASGNAGGDACNYSPAQTPDALTVGATDDFDFRWPGSNYGNCVDLFAPGLYIASSYVGSPTAIATLSGTSMAAPHVAGVAALYFEKHPRASAFEVNNAIKSGATPGVVVNPGAGSPNLLLYSQIQ
jgi:subtilisin family serine protease